MSIYAVRLKEWYPPGNEMYEFTKSICGLVRCYACGRRVSYRKAIGHHSVPWGYGDLWCSAKCHKAYPKKAKPDRRLERRLKRIQKCVYLGSFGA